MSAAYDKYDYSSYWQGREYEHGDEIHALRKFLDKIPSIGKILEIGAGFGRLAPVYEHRAKQVVLSDPSARLLKSAREKHKNPKFKFIHSSLESLVNKVRPHSFDLIMMVRVLHHMNSPEEVFHSVSHLIKPGGYFILEFANKKHFKANVREIIKGNLTYTADIFQKDIRSENGRRICKLPFNNFHPEVIEQKLKEAGFSIVEKRSVSNVRSPVVKSLVPADVLLYLTQPLQKHLAYINFGPSIFILAKKNK